MVNAMSRSPIIPRRLPLASRRLLAALALVFTTASLVPQARAVMFVLDDFINDPETVTPGSPSALRPPSGTEAEVAYIGDMSLDLSVTSDVGQTSSIVAGTFSFALDGTANDSVTLGYGSAVTGSSFEIPEGVTNVRLTNPSLSSGGSYEVVVAFLDSGGNQLGNTVDFTVATSGIASLFASFVAAGIADPDDIGGMTITFTGLTGGTLGAVSGGLTSVLLVPEPSSALLLTAGLWILLAGRRRPRC